MADEPQDRHDRITHMDLLNLWREDMGALRGEIRNEMREMRNEMRRMIGVGFALLLLFMAFVTFVR